MNSRRSPRMMIPKMLLVIITMVYFIPVPVERTHVSCGCGCGEFTCSCCVAPQNCGDGAAYKPCRCNIHDEVYEPFPTIASPLFRVVNPVYKIGTVLCNSTESALPGFKDPPMKPPPVIM